MHWWVWIVIGAILLGSELAFVEAQFYLVFLGAAALVVGLLDFAGDATLLYYMSEEAKEGKNAFIERRKPDFDQFPRLP